MIAIAVICMAALLLTIANCYFYFRNRRETVHSCRYCGYPLLGLGEQGACPECGRQFDYAARAIAKRDRESSHLQARFPDHLARSRLRGIAVGLAAASVLIAIVLFVLMLFDVPAASLWKIPVAMLGIGVLCMAAERLRLLRKAMAHEWMLCPIYLHETVETSSGQSCAHCSADLGKINLRHVWMSRIAAPLRIRASPMLPRAAISVRLMPMMIVLGVIMLVAGGVLIQFSAPLAVALACASVGLFFLLMPTVVWRAEKARITDQKYLLCPRCRSTFVEEDDHAICKECGYRARTSVVRELWRLYLHE